MKKRCRSRIYGLLARGKAVTAIEHKGHHHQRTTMDKRAFSLAPPSTFLPPWMLLISRFRSFKKSALVRGKAPLKKISLPLSLARFLKNHSLYYSSYTNTHSTISLSLSLIYQTYSSSQLTCKCCIPTSLLFLPPARSKLENLNFSLFSPLRSAISSPI